MNISRISIVKWLIFALNRKQCNSGKLALPNTQSGIHLITSKAMICDNIIQLIAIVNL